MFRCQRRAAAIARKDKLILKLQQDKIALSWELCNLRQVCANLQDAVHRCSTDRVLSSLDTSTSQPVEKQDGQTQTDSATYGDLITFDMVQPALHLCLYSSADCDAIYDILGKAFRAEGVRLKRFGAQLDAVQREYRVLADIPQEQLVPMYEEQEQFIASSHDGLSIAGILRSLSSDLPLMAEGMRELVSTREDAVANAHKFADALRQLRVMKASFSQRIAQSNDVASSSGMDRGLMEFEEGDLVEIVNLENQQQLNGQLGFVLRWDHQRGGYQIISGEDTVKLLKLANIRLADG